MLWKYRNVINPWQTPREIRSAEKMIDRMLAKLKLTQQEEFDLLRAEAPDRDWSKPK